MSALGPLARRSPVDGEPQLNWDVLTEIMSYLSRANASRMARTCRTLLQVSPRFLLTGTVTLLTTAQAISFRKFVQRPERRSSMHYFRRLSIPLLVDALTILRRATELEWLDIGRGHIIWDGRTVDALVSLKKLRVLLIQSPTKETINLLEGMQAPLARVDADLFAYEGSRYQNPITVFTPFNKSLEVMMISSAQFSNSDDQVRYPNVHTLGLEESYNFPLRILGNCFPGVQNLLVSGMYSGYYENQRQRNREAQGSIECWPSLRRLAGNVAGLYALALRSNIEHLSVASSMLTPTDVPRLSSVLRDVGGLQSLYLRIKLPEFDLLHLIGTLRPVKETLGELMLRLDYRGRNYKEVAPYLSAMIDNLAGTGFQLRALRLCVRWFYNGPPEGESSGLDHYAIAEHAMQAFSGLREVYVEVEPAAAEFEIQSTVEADGRLKRTLQSVGDEEGFVEPDTLFGNDYFWPWLSVTGVDLADIRHVV